MIAASSPHKTKLSISLSRIKRLQFGDHFLRMLEMEILNSTLESTL